MPSPSCRLPPAASPRTLCHWLPACADLHNHGSLPSTGTRLPLCQKKHQRPSPHTPPSSLPSVPPNPTLRSFTPRPSIRQHCKALSTPVKGQATHHQGARRPPMQGRVSNPVLHTLLLCTHSQWKVARAVAGVMGGPRPPMRGRLPLQGWPSTAAPFDAPTFHSNAGKFRLATPGAHQPW